MDAALAYLLSSSAVLLSTAALYRSAWRLFWGRRAKRELEKELASNYGQLLDEWRKRLDQADYDASSVGKIQKELELVVLKRMREQTLRGEVMDALHQPSVEGRRRYLQDVLEQSSNEQRQVSAHAH